jgi:cytoskeletal protein CcmA (bactofilin family)
VLGPADRLVGQLYIEGDLRVSGTVEGALEATGDIVISDGGKVNGAVTAYNRLVVGTAASLVGSDVRVGRLTVEDGATFSGHVSMGKEAVEQRPKPVEAVAAEATPEPVAEATPEPMAEATPVEQPVDVVNSEPEKRIQKGKRR